MAFVLEKQVAIAAVQRACKLTASVFNKLVKNETVVKGDKSPVTGSFRSHILIDPLYSWNLSPSCHITVADYSAQAVINSILHRAFPQDPIVGEESASDLRSDTSEKSTLLKKRITELATEALVSSLEPR